MITLFGTLLAVLLTLAIFSRAFAVTTAFRWASHLLLGAGAGYIAALVLKQVLLPAYSPRAMISAREWSIALLATVLMLLLLLRWSRQPVRRAWGLLPLGVMAGVGGALILAGAMRGSLLPQLMAVSQLQLLPQSPQLDKLSIVLATMTSLGVVLYLVPGPETPELTDDTPPSILWLLYSWRLWGYWALMLALGILLASTAGARITLLIDRVRWLLHVWP